MYDEEGRGGRALLVSGDGRAWACCQINHRHSSLWLGEDADEEVVEHPVLRCLYRSQWEHDKVRMGRKECLMVFVASVESLFKRM